MENSVNTLIDKINIVGTELQISSMDFDLWSSTVDSTEYKQSQQYKNNSNHLDRIKHWQTNVANGNHIILGIYFKNENRLIGIIDFYEINNGKCLTGINIFPSTNLNKGYAFNAYKLCFPILKNRKKIKQICVLLHPNQASAKKLYAKLGFTFVSTVIDDEWDWEKHCLDMENK